MSLRSCAEPAQCIRSPPRWHDRQGAVRSAADVVFAKTVVGGTLVLRMCSSDSPWQDWHALPDPHGVRRSPLTACFVDIMPPTSSSWHLRQTAPGASAGTLEDRALGAGGGGVAEVGAAPCALAVAAETARPTATIHLPAAIRFDRMTASLARTAPGRARSQTFCWRRPLRGNLRLAGAVLLTLLRSIPLLTPRVI